KNTDQVKDMVSSNQLQEFRDRDRLMFKVEQVDLLAGGKDEESIPLADSGELEPLSLASSGSASGIMVSPETAKEQTGISIFDADATEEADPSAVTRVSAAPSLADPGRSGSGSGLLDMTKDQDDTSLGANLLDDVYGNETVAQQTAVEPAADEGGALFESPAATDADTAMAAASAAAVMPMMAGEPYDGAGSGLVGGLSFAAAVALLVAAFAVVLGLTGVGDDLIAMLGDNFLPIVGGLGGLTLIAAGLGFVLGKKS
ncbi:MAG: hypothetical protein JNL50_03635, partial [Phycisphaerae bacterium]|nr:hypothetical protein [Phycisphaerae bacterium]